MRVLFVSAEAYPLAKTGGLADVSSALPAALASLGVDIRLLFPGYPQALDRVADARTGAQLENDRGIGEMRLVSGRMPDTGLPVWLLDCPRLFRRGGGLYTDDDGHDWPDNAMRFSIFSHAAARLAQGIPALSWRPDVVHANDWHAGLLPALLAARAGQRPATLFTIHNMSFQGIFPSDVFPELGLPPETFTPEGVEYHGNVSFLKAGIRYADKLTTVSPTYAREICSSDQGFGLQGLLRQRAQDLSGILNGVDYGVWDPAHDLHLPCRYDASDLSGKGECKRGLQEELGLGAESDVPLIAFVSRLTDQKMADVVLAALPWLIEQRAQFVLLGEGDRGLEQAFREAGESRPDKRAVRIGYEEPLAHRIQAGADLLLAPARFEPCGLMPMYALRYGTVPVVRRTGGLANTVVEATARATRANIATGFVFHEPTVGAMVHCIARALKRYRQPVSWRRIQLAGMRQDFGWQRSASWYLGLYDRLVGAVGDSLRGVRDLGRGHRLVDRQGATACGRLTAGAFRGQASPFPEDFETEPQAKEVG